MSDDTVASDTSDKATPRDKPKRGPVIALLLGSLLFALILVEIGMRVAGWGQVMEYASDPDFGYLMKPNQAVYSYGHPVTINERGLRGPALASPKPVETKRIVFLGDSVTYGGGHIRDEELFSRIFETKANAEGLHVEVVLIAAPGWSPQNWKGYIEKRGLEDADRVVLVLPECDLGRPFTTMKMHGFTDNAPSLRTVASLLKIGDMLGPSAFGTFDGDVEAPKNIAAVEALIAKAGERPFLPVFIPGVPEMPQHHPYWPRFEAVLPNALDMRVALNDRKLFMDGVHLNQEGHRALGEALLERLRPELK